MCRCRRLRFQVVLQTASPYCVLLQSKTAEHREHFGVFQDPRTKTEWEKAGDLR